MDKQDKIIRYRQLNQTAQKGQIVFAGSSLMEMFPIEQFVAEDNLPVVVYNRGIGGFVTDELRRTLLSAFLISRRGCCSSTSARTTCPTHPAQWRKSWGRTGRFWRKCCKRFRTCRFT